MKPIRADTSNCILKGTGEVQDLPITRLEFQNGSQAVESCWELSKEELEKINETGRIYFVCMGNTHPPILLDVESQIKP